MTSRRTEQSCAVKIAYICLCHTDPSFVARTAKTLQYKEDGFFIHVDRKTDMDPFSAVCSGLSNVYFVKDRIDNNWGGFNSIIATMRTIQLALATDNYDRFILLQGQDYPLFSPKEIHAFFEDHADVEFCKGNDISHSKLKKEYMKCCGFWLFDVKPGSPLYLIRGVFHKFNKLGIKYRPATFTCGNENWSLYHGWAQFALTKNCILHVLSVYENNQDYNNFMRHRFPPDEIYIHTIIHNSQFKDKVSRDIIIRRSGEKTLLNLTYFEYPKFVTVFKVKEDYQCLKNTGCLFVRKVNSGSSDLLEEIDKYIL